MPRNDRRSGGAGKALAPREEDIGPRMVRRLEKTGGLRAPEQREE